MIAYAIAAAAWDVAVVNASQPDSQIPGTGITGVQLQQTHHREDALRIIDREIVQLMQLSTPFTFATTFQDTMLRYVFLRRAMQGHVSIDEVQSSPHMLKPHDDNGFA